MRCHSFFLYADVTARSCHGPEGQSNCAATDCRLVAVHRTSRTRHRRRWNSTKHEIWPEIQIHENPWASMKIHENRWTSPGLWIFRAPLATTVPGCRLPFSGGFGGHLYLPWLLRASWLGDVARLESVDTYIIYIYIYLFSRVMWNLLEGSNWVV